MTPTLIEMVHEWLHDHGYEGLCNPDAECGCDIDDLMPCGCPNEDDCRAGYRHIYTGCSGCGDVGDCNVALGLVSDEDMGWPFYFESKLPCHGKGDVHG